MFDSFSLTDWLLFNSKTILVTWLKQSMESWVSILVNTLYFSRGIIHHNFIWLLHYMLEIDLSRLLFNKCTTRSNKILVLFVLFKINFLHKNLRDLIIYWKWKLIYPEKFTENLVNANFIVKILIYISGFQTFFATTPFTAGPKCQRPLLPTNARTTVMLNVMRIGWFFNYKQFEEYKKQF